MAKVIRSLTSQARQEQCIKKNTVTYCCQQETDQQDVSTAKRPSLLARKKAKGTEVVRERKTPLSTHLFTNMTPRQVKRIKNDPNALKALIEKHKENND